MLGNVKNEAGLLFNKRNFKLVKKVLKKRIQAKELEMAKRLWTM